MFEGPWPALYWFELGFLLRVCNTLKILYVLYRFQCHEHEHNKKPRVPNHLQVMQHYNIYIYIQIHTLINIPQCLKNGFLSLQRLAVVEGIL